MADNTLKQWIISPKDSKDDQMLLTNCKDKVTFILSSDIASRFDIIVPEENMYISFEDWSRMYSAISGKEPHLLSDIYETGLRCLRSESLACDGLTRDDLFPLVKDYACQFYVAKLMRKECYFRASFKKHDQTFIFELKKEKNKWHMLIC